MLIRHIIPRSYEFIIEEIVPRQTIIELFKEVEKTHNNNTITGKSKKVVSLVNNMLKSAGSWLQHTKPVKSFDSEFEKIKQEIRRSGQDTPWGRQTMQLVDQLGNVARENPDKANFIIGAIMTAAGIASSPAGGILTGQFLRGTLELAKGEKISSAIGKSATVFENRRMLNEINLRKQAKKLAHAGIKKISTGSGITSTGLIDAWEKAGASTDSEQIMNFLHDMGIAHNVITSSYKKLGIAYDETYDHDIVVFAKKLKTDPETANQVKTYLINKIK